MRNLKVMTRKFKGNNDLKSSHDLYYYRTKFSNEAYEGDLGPKCSKDLNFAEYQHYAQLDLDGNPIVPNENKLVGLRAPNQPAKVFYVFDFVADMFIDLKTNIELALVSGKLCKTNPIFNNFAPVSAYVSPENDYKTYLNELMALYAQTVIPEIYGNDNIMDFKSFVKNFFNFVDDFAVGVPITYTGWLISKSAGIKHTGISLRVAETPYSDDQAKVDDFIDTPQMPYYELALTNLGFAFDFQNPSVLFADLSSPAIAKYYNKFNITSLNDMFNKYYIKSYYKDISILIDRLIHFYNLYITINPHQIKFDLCQNKTKWHWERRTAVSPSQISTMFKSSYWLSKLIDLRNHESGGKIDKGKIRKIKKYSSFLSKTLDNNQALDYINNETKDLFFKREFGFEDIKRRVLARSQAEVKSRGITGKSVFGGGGY